MASNYNRSQQSSGEAVVDSNVWTSLKVQQILEMIDDGKSVKSTPFYDGNPEWRAGNIVFEYTPEEMVELRRCASDVIYFANNYCFVMTDDGVVKLSKTGGLRSYQLDILKDYQNNRKCILMSARQSGKTICTGIFLAWYLLFNIDKNLMILSDVGDTTREILDKIKVILANLPFFMKPGILKNDVMTMKFDNGCRMFGRNTTKKAGIGFAIHFLYVDEFAHIHPNFIHQFWRTVHPTLSSSKISRCILTSTPNGMNLFYDIYIGALEGKSDFKAMRVDWWQVPGRTEDWKQKQIAELGSEEAFNQEFGCQFLESSSLLLDGKSLNGIKSITKEYKWMEISELHDTGINYEWLKWHPLFNPLTIRADDRETDMYVFSIDTAGGGGGDYSVINIFKLIPLPLPLIKNVTNFRDEADFFSLMQVGVFRSNVTPIEDLQIVLETLLYRVFNQDNVRIVLEMDFKGNLLYEKMSGHDAFWDDNFIRTRHSEAARIRKPGIKLNPKNKLAYCLEMRRLVKTGRIIINDRHTFDELRSFGINKNGTYSSQIGHDDLAMTLVNMSTVFDSEYINDMVGAVYDEMPEKYKAAINEKLTGADVANDSNGMNFDALRGMMDGPGSDSVFTRTPRSTGKQRGGDGLDLFRSMME